jgi:Carboxypeptidase regulatory-like domain
MVAVNGKVRSVQARRIPELLLMLLCCFEFCPAQNGDLKKPDRDIFRCVVGFDRTDREDCGPHSDWYAYVFVGSISAIHAAAGGEKELVITPEEVFHGVPENPINVLTVRGECLPKLAVGDGWLFSLRKEEGKQPILEYGTFDSGPVADEQSRIETLRRLQQLGDSAILRGRVTREMFGSEDDGVPRARVIARRQSDDALFTSTSGAHGDYEFQPLPPGNYQIDVDPIEAFHPAGSFIELKEGQCWWLSLYNSPEAQIAGHVRRIDGSPVAGATIVLTNADDSLFYTDSTDSDGRFGFDGLDPGEYVAGLRPLGSPPAKIAGCAGGCADKIPTVSLYYRNETNRSGAFVIKLATDEKREDIDFIVPAP